MAEEKVFASLAMDRSDPIGNSKDALNRRALHVFNMGSVLGNIAFDSGTVLYPDNITEVFEFRLGGITGTIQATLTLVYANASKKDLVSWSKS